MTVYMYRCASCSTVRELVAEKVATACVWGRRNGTAYLCGFRIKAARPVVVPS